MVLSITIALSGILAIIAGLLIILRPRLIRWALGLYLILFGILRMIDFSLV